MPLCINHIEYVNVCFRSKFSFVIWKMNPAEQKKEKTRKLFGLMAGEERLYLGATKDTVPPKLM